MANPSSKNFRLATQEQLNPSQRSRPVRKAPPRLQRFSSRVLTSLARQTRFMDPALGQRWSEIVGEEIAMLCWPGRLSPGRQHRTLEVITPNGATATKLTYQTEQILSAVNKIMGPRAVTHISIKQNSKTRQDSETTSRPYAGGNAAGNNDEELTLDEVLARFRSLKD